MDVIESNKTLAATHGVVSNYPNDFFGYFGWPTLAQLDDGTLVAAASGLRNSHLCPFGRSVICISEDEGQTWSSPRVVNDSPLDDRDTGIVSLGSGRMLLSWFTSDNRRLKEEDLAHLEPTGDHRQRWLAGTVGVSDETVSRFRGSWVRISGDRGATWDPPIKVDLTAPHGPIRLRSSKLFYLGKEFPADHGAITAMESTDDGTTWERLGSVPLYEGTEEAHYHEPHVAELSDGQLLGLIRIEDAPGANTLEEKGLTHFSMLQTQSDDGGRTWSRADPMGFHGSPPHLLVHSSGTLICAYGRRIEPCGERIMISRDSGKSWTYDLVLCNAPHRDLGYPSSVELNDGRIMTMYYQRRESAAEKCALLWSRWELPR